MRAIWMAVLSASLVAACSSTPTEEQPPAKVEEGARSDTQGAQTKPVDQNQVSKVDLTGSNRAGGALAAVKSGILAERSIYYDLDQYDVKDQYKAMVEAHGRFLRENPTVKMLIQGNTDERGSREYNIGLGQRRSDGVKRMLILLGAREDQVESVSLGEEKPKSEGHDDQAWAQNRRSDILYQGEF